MGCAAATLTSGPLRIASQFASCRLDAEGTQLGCNYAGRHNLPNATPSRRMPLARTEAGPCGLAVGNGAVGSGNAHRRDRALGAHLPGGYRLGDLHRAEPARDAA